MSDESTKGRPPDPEEEIFEACLARPLEERAGYLNQVCAGDAALRQRVEELLRSHKLTETFLEEPPVSLGAGQAIPLDVPLAEKVGDHIGRYKLLQQIGEGGCGLVYMAEQEEPVKRRVALKVIKLGMDTKNVIARFEAERQALALMDHPNIAKVLDAGATDKGRPYFVMELVRGVKITDYCDQNGLSTRERLLLFVQVCQAIQHAHQKGIIHRDIKPSNILVTLRDGVPVPKVIDFGIAKATTDQRLTDKTLFTAFEQFIGTPTYMSPEQAEMSELGIDTRSDIYSLGVLLYELLTGQTPFDSNRLLQSGLDEIRRIIREQEPVRPSTRLNTMLAGELTTAAQCRQTEPAKLSGLMRGDLDWIVMKCLEKDRARRYETANGLGMDLQRHLQNEPVVACPPSLGYILHKAIRRHKLAFGALSGVAASLIVGLGLSTWLYLQERKQERVARQNAYVSDLVAASHALEEGNFGSARKLLSHQRPRAGEDDLRAFEWRYLSGQSQGGQFKTLLGHSDFVECVAYSPDGSTLASGSYDQTIKLWNAITGELMATFEGHIGEIISLAFSRDGKFLAGGGKDGLVRLWDAQTQRVTLTITNSLPHVAFSDRVLAVATDGDDWGHDRGTVELWDYLAGRRLKSLPESGNRVAFAPDGKYLATANWNSRVKLWDADTGTQLRSVSCDLVRSMAFSPDGRMLTWASNNHVWLWEFSQSQPKILAESKPGNVDAVAFCPDGTTIASANQDHSITMLSITPGIEPVKLRGHGGEVRAVAFSPRSNALASGGRDNAVMVWHPQTREADSEITNVLTVSRGIGNPVFSHDGKTLASALLNGGILLSEVATGRTGIHLDTFDVPVAFTADGRCLLTQDRNLRNTLRSWDLGTRAPTGSTRYSGDAWSNYCDSFSDDMKWVAVQQRNSQVVVDSTLTGELLFTLQLPFAPWAIAFSPDGKLGTGGYDGSAAVWDSATQRLVFAVDRFKDTVQGLAFSPDGRLFAAGSWDTTIKVIDLRAKKKQAILIGHKAGVLALAFSSDGRTLASGGDDESVRLWNIATGNEVLKFELASPVKFLGFSPDGRTLAAGTADRKVYLWHAPTVGEIDASDQARTSTGIAP